MTFGEKLRMERERLSVTQGEVSSAIGVSKNTITNYERGASHPKDREIYFKLAEFFGVNVNYFLTDDEAFITGAAERYGRKGALEANAILQQAEALFAGGELSEEDRIGFLHAMQKIYFDASDHAKEKYTPKKYRKPKKPTAD